MFFSRLTVKLILIWAKTEGSRNMILDRHSIRWIRIMYLRAVQKYEEVERNIM
jgi:hypothetical protein